MELIWELEKDEGSGREQEKKIKNSLLVFNKVSLSSNLRQICCRMGDMNIEKDDRQQIKLYHQERWEVVVVRELKNAGNILAIIEK